MNPLNFFRNFYHPVMEDNEQPRHRRANVASDTIFAIAASALAWMGANAFEREAPAFSAVLRTVPAFAAAIWLLRRFSCHFPAYWNPFPAVYQPQQTYVQQPPVVVHQHPRQPYVAPVPIYQQQPPHFVPLNQNRHHPSQNGLHTLPQQRNPFPNPVNGGMHQLPTQRFPQVNRVNPHSQAQPTFQSRAPSTGNGQPLMFNLSKNR